MSGVWCSTARRNKGSPWCFFSTHSKSWHIHSFSASSSTVWAPGLITASVQLIAQSPLECGEVPHTSTTLVKNLCEYSFSIHMCLLVHVQEGQNGKQHICEGVSIWLPLGSCLFTQQTCTISAYDRDFWRSFRIAYCLYGLCVVCSSNVHSKEKGQIVFFFLFSWNNCLTVFSKEAKGNGLGSEIKLFLL